jgi:hypothetical protein
MNGTEATSVSNGIKVASFIICPNGSDWVAVCTVAHDGMKFIGSEPYNQGLCHRAGAQLGKQLTVH